MNRIDRLLGILTLIQSRKYTSAEKIAEKFNISIRTVYRDLKAIGEQDIPISFEPQKGYFIVSGYFLAPISFSSDEANALLLMEYLVKGFTDKSISKNYSSALEKVKTVLKQNHKNNLEELSQHIQFQIPARLTNEFEYLSVLQKSIIEKTIIEIEYINNQAIVSKRKLEPIGLIFYAFSWHLIAWCHSRRNNRDFKIASIKKLTNTLLPFSKTDHISLEEYKKEIPVDY